jgi:hypothetical protein
MVSLILATEKCGGIDWIDVASDVHVEVSHGSGFDVTVRNHVVY